MQQKIGFLCCVVGLVCCIQVAIVHAIPVFLSCPYEEEIPNSFRVSIDRFTDAICVERGFVNCGHSGQIPWTEQQVENGNAIVYADVLVPMLATLTTAQPIGAGCTQLTRGELVADIARPAESRTLFRQAIRARDGKLIAPISDNVIRDLESRVPTRVTWWEKGLRYIVERVFGGKSVYALGSFPDVGLTDAFTRANETPIGTPWAEWDTDDLNFNLASNHIEPVGAQASIYHTGSLGPADADAHITGTVVSGVFEVGTRGVNVGTTIPDGYSVRASTGGSALTARRWDDGVSTQLGTSVTQTITNGDMIGIRIVGSTVSVYFNDNGAGWTEITTRTDATYTAGGYGFVIGNLTGLDLDDFGATILATQKPNIGMYLLRR